MSRQDKPSLALMGLTTDDPSALHCHPVVSWFEPQAAGEIRWKYSEEPTEVHHFGAEWGIMHTQDMFCSLPPDYGVGK